MMKEIVLLSCIKGEPKLGLKECLLCHNKYKLLDIAEQHDIKLDDDLAEAEIVDKLTPLLLKNILKDLTYLSARELKFLNTIPKQDPQITQQKIGRNDPCPCGSGKKYKNAVVRSKS
jgi:uncharacterized protein YecA (UPF0149 family)